MTNDLIKLKRKSRTSKRKDQLKPPVPEKTIDTLLEDVRKLLDEGCELEATHLATFTQNLSSLLLERFRSYSKPREQYLRMSNLGKNPLQVYYDIKGYPDDSDNMPELLDANTKLKFLFGDIVEQLAILLARSAGHTVTNEQRVVDVDGVLGSIDCLIDEELVDVKSASTRGLLKFASEKELRQDDPFGYIKQISGYATGMGKDRAYFWAIGKETGDMRLCRVRTDEVGEDIQRLRETLSSDLPPYRCANDRPEGSSGNRRLASPCTYCTHKRECWKDSNNGEGLRVFKYSSGPKHLTEVVRLPDVPEITKEFQRKRPK